MFKFIRNTAVFKKKVSKSKKKKHFKSIPNTTKYYFKVYSLTI